MIYGASLDISIKSHDDPRSHALIHLYLALIIQKTKYKIYIN